MNGQPKPRPRATVGRQGNVPIKPTASTTPKASKQSRAHASSSAKPRHTSASPSDLKNNLRSQTPLNRKLRQQTTPTEPGTSRRATTRQYYRVKADKKKRRSILGMRVLLTLICYAILLPVSLFFVSLWLPHHTTPETGDFIYQIGPDKDYLSRKTYGWSTVRSGDIYYLDMTGIASYCNLATTGDSKKIRYIVKETGETVEFILGQSIAYINGIPERMGGDVYEKSGKIYVPLDFVSRVFTGLSVTLDLEKNKITLLRVTNEKEEPLVISFPVKNPDTTPEIDFDTLDTELQNQILYPTTQPTDPTAPTDPSTP